MKLTNLILIFLLLLFNISFTSSEFNQNLIFKNIHPNKDLTGNNELIQRRVSFLQEKNDKELEFEKIQPNLLKGDVKRELLLAEVYGSYKNDIDNLEMKEVEDNNDKLNESTSSNLISQNEEELDQLKEKFKEKNRFRSDSHLKGKSDFDKSKINYNELISKTQKLVKKIKISTQSLEPGTVFTEENSIKNDDEMTDKEMEELLGNKYKNVRS